MAAHLSMVPSLATLLNNDSRSSLAWSNYHAAYICRQLKGGNTTDGSATCGVTGINSTRITARQPRPLEKQADNHLLHLNRFGSQQRLHQTQVSRKYRADDQHHGYTNARVGTDCGCSPTPYLSMQVD